MLGLSIAPRTVCPGCHCVINRVHMPALIRPIRALFPASAYLVCAGCRRAWICLRLTSTP